GSERHRARGRCASAQRSRLAGQVTNVGLSHQAVDRGVTVVGDCDREPSLIPDTVRSLGCRDELDAGFVHGKDHPYRRIVGPVGTIRPVGTISAIRTVSAIGTIRAVRTVTALGAVSAIGTIRTIRPAEQTTKAI